MKIKAILLSLLMGPVLTTAQNITSKKAQLGFTATPTFGWISLPTGQTPVIESDGLRTGFSYGVIADFPFSDNYYFSTALAVSTINAKTREQVSTGAATNLSTSVYKLQYLELPLTLKLKSNEIQNKRFYGQFGLSTSIKMTSKKDVMYTNPTKKDVKNMDILHEINIVRTGLLIGGGAEWKIGGSMALLTGVSYSNGISDIFNFERKAKNSYMALNLGIFF